jgi:hypothetical protein
MYETGFGFIPEEYVYIMQKAVNQSVAEKQRKILELEGEIYKEQTRASTYEDFYLAAVEQAVQLEIQLKALQRSIDGN